MADIKATMGLDASGVKIGLSSAMADVKGFASKVAGAFGVGVGLNMLKGAIETTASLGDLAEQTGLTIKEFQVLRNVSNNVGADFEKTQASVRRLMDNLGEAKGGGPAVALFEKLGISFKQVQTMTPEEAIKAVGAALSGATPGTERYSDVLNIIGSKTGPEAVGALREFANVLGDVKAESATGMIVSDADVQNARTLVATMKDYWIIVQSLVAQGIGGTVRAIGGAGVTAGVEETEAGGSARVRRDMQLRAEADLQAFRDKQALMAKAKELTPTQEKELTTLREQSQASYERLLAIQEEDDLLQGIITQEDLLLRIQNEKLRIAEQLRALGGRTDFAAQKKSLELSMEQDKLTQREYKTTQDIRKRDEDAAKKAAEENQKELDNYVENELKKRAIKAKAAEDITEAETKTSVSAMAVDQLARIGGQIGGAVNPALTVAMRQLKVSETIATINAKMAADIAKLEIGLGA